MGYAADLWNLVLDSTANSDDLPMGPGTPPFFLAQLVWAYERHLRKPQNASFPNQYLQEQGGETTASLSSVIYMADSSSSNKEQALVIVVPVGLPPELHQCAPEYFLVVDSGATLFVGCNLYCASQRTKLINWMGWCRFTLSMHSYWPLMWRDLL